MGSLYIKLPRTPKMLKLATRMRINQSRDILILVLAITLNITWLLAVFLFGEGSTESHKYTEQKLIFQTGTLSTSGINERFAFSCVMIPLKLEMAVHFTLLTLLLTISLNFLMWLYRERRLRLQVV